MKVSLFISLILIGLHYSSATAQSANRREIIAMLLEKPKLQISTSVPHSTYSLTQPQDASQSFRNYDPVLRFQLPRGAIVCRFEEYMQLHTPFKVNIGVGGE